MSNIVPVKQAPLACLAGYGGGVPGLFYLGAVGTSLSLLKSLRFDQTTTAHLNRTPSTAGNKKTWTWSGWVKRCTNGNRDGLFEAESSGNYTLLRIRADTDRISLDQSGGSNFYVYTDAVFRDNSAWYHIVCAVDTTQATDSNRVKIYVNGVQQTLTAGTNWPAQNIDTRYNDTSYAMRVGGVNGGSQFDGYMTDVYFVDGSQLDPTSFGAYDSNGVWQAAAFSGTYGTNGFHLLDFANESTVGHDSSGNENDYTANNLTESITPLQGYAGGDSYLYSGGNSGGGGGGGAGGAGAQSVSGSTAGAGGTGRASTITGSSVTYGGGGGGGSWGTAGGAGGAGGGGAGKLGGSSTGAANPGTDGLGGGGGGAGYASADWQAGGDGGSGRVIIRYATSHGDLTSANSGSKTTSGSDTIYQWTTVGSGSITFPGSSSISVQYLVLGGGGGAETGGGGGGGVLEGTLTVTGGTSHTVTVGDGGTGASPYPSPGAASNGGNSVFSTITALGGGRGGGGDSGAAPTSGGSGGGGGSVSGATTGGAGTGQPESDLDVLFDVPTNGTQSDTGVGGEVSGNYATFNPLDSENGTLTNGNLVTTSGAGTSFGPQNTTIGVSSGKWYSEITWTSGSYALVGITHEGSAGKSGTTWHRDSATFTWYFSGAFMSAAWPGTSTFPDGSNPTFAVGDVVGVLLDKDNDKLYFTKNGSYVASMNAATGTNGIDISAHSGEIAFITCGNNDSSSSSFTLNAGQRAFAYNAASGYKALCTTNLPTPTIPDSSTAFDTRLWTGDANASRALAGLNMAPDLLWFKKRNSAYDHYFFDSVRGNTKELKPNTTDAEGTTSNKLISFDSAGFTVGNATAVNASGDTYVAWAWDAGSSTVSNTDGSITSYVRANTSAGFSIVGYTGTGSNATVGHGLNAAPEFVIVKSRDMSSSDWCVYHSGLSSTSHVLALHSTGAEENNSSTFQGTAPTSAVFSLGTRGSANGSGNDHIAYCMAPVEGYSAFGSYKGNGSLTNGSFTFLGFTPALVIIKNTQSSGSYSSWGMWDSARNINAPALSSFNNPLWANRNVQEGKRGDGSSSASGAENTVHLLSNGFQVFGNGTEYNNSGVKYVYAAWAENPFQANGGLAR
jgi:hypothetical protein